jgi:hypothetical protein
LFFGFQLPDTISGKSVNGKISKHFSLILDNVEFTGNYRNALNMDNSLGGGDGNIVINNCQISSGISGVTIFASNDALNVNVIVYNSFFHETGIEANGDGVQKGGTTNGFHVYLHPWINANIDNCQFYNYDRGGIKWFSTSDPVSSQNYANISNCTFIGNSEADDIGLLGHAIANITNCTGTGTLRIRQPAKITNSDFEIIAFNNVREGAEIYINNTGTRGMSEEFISSSGNFNVYLNQVMIKPKQKTNAMAFDTQSGNWTINDCEFVADGSNSIAVQNRGGNMTFNNCKLWANHTSGNFSAVTVSSTTFSDRTIKFSDCSFAGTQIIATGNPTYQTNIIFNECEVEESINNGNLNFRFFGANITEVTKNRKHNTKPVLAEKDGTQLDMQKKLEYFYSVPGTIDTIRSIQANNPVIDPAIKYYDEVRLIFNSNVVFDSTATSNFSFEQNFSNGDIIVLRYDDEEEEWEIISNASIIFNVDTLQSQNTTLRDTTAATAAFTIRLKEENHINTSEGSVTAQVPAGAQIGDVFSVYAGESAGTNSVTIDFVTNGYTVLGASVSRVLNTNFQYETYRYVGDGNWIIISKGP